MKLTPFETAIERVAERIVRKNRKELEAHLKMLYSGAVSQAVEFLQAKTSPAVKANKTRKEIARLKAALHHVTGNLERLKAQGSSPTTEQFEALQNFIADALEDRRHD